MRPNDIRPVFTAALITFSLAAPLLLQGQGSDITGTWAADRRPRDPKLAPPAPTPLLLRPQYDAPYKARLAKERAAEERGEPLANGSTACVPYGMPQMMSAIYPLEILQTKGQVTIITEAFSEVRRIYLDEPQLKIGEPPPGYYGHSVGRWENNILMVDTIGVKPEVLGYRGMPHSDQMHIREQFQLVAPDILHDQITVEDPVVLEKPWTFTFSYRRMPGYKLLEYVCENNREYVDENGVVRLKLGDK
ncbi:MAG: hypothetical protein JO323_00875 [Acidobacteriia bacterium]|nr:hypothetical protein [Terriglobia bacterium]